jgi:Skp family chaperone for outer membrane proteins
MMIALELLVLVAIASALGWFAPRILPRTSWPLWLRAVFGAGVALLLFLLLGLYHLSTGEGLDDATGLQQAVLCRVHHFAHCPRKAGEAEVPVVPGGVAAPRVLVLDRALIYARYVKTGAKDAVPRIGAELTQLMDQYDANLLLDRAAIVSGGQSVDITPQLVADLDKTLAHGAGAAPAAVTIDTDTVDAPRFVVANRAVIAGALPQNVNVAPKLEPALHGILQERAANLALDRNAVVLGLIEIDATNDIVRKLDGQPSANQAPVAAPVVVVIDRGELFGRALAGQALTAQVRDLLTTARAELKPRGDALLAEQTALKAKLSTLSDADKQTQIAAFRAKYAVFQADVVKRQSAIAAALAPPRKQLQDALGPILKALMKERGANLLLDRKAVVLGRSKNVDVTGLAITRLDAALPSVTVQTP